MIYPPRSCIVMIKTMKKPIWRLAMFFWNGETPIFAQFGSEVNDVIEWREPTLEEIKKH